MLFRSGKVIILNVTFKLFKVTESQSHRVTKSSVVRLDYGDIRGELHRLGVTDATIVEVREAVCNIRRRKLPDPAEVGNAGSFFKNPVICKDLMVSLQNRFPGMPFYPQPSEKGPVPATITKPGACGFPEKSMVPDHVKIPAAWLIEQCGWKGYRNGDAGVHPNQPLVLVNYGNASGQQILVLATQIMDSVYQKFGITLETEVNVVG